MPRILIVDDERAIRSLLSRCFTQAGYEVAAAATPFEAISLCETTDFDAMLSDVDMPKMDGHDLVRWVIANHPIVRCALMSGESIQCTECPITGKCTLLRKPFSPRKAVAVVAEMLSGSAEPGAS